MRTDAMLRDPEAAMGMMSAIMEFNPLLEEIAAERKGCPADDLISVWTEAGYDPMTMMHETGLFIAGGAETTRTVIARGLAVLAEHPDQWEAAAADPSLVAGLVEEVIRWVTPLNNMFRRVTRDDHIGDQPVAAGDRVMLAYPSANRDEDVFDDPFTFDIRRDPNPHLAFGQGTHFCVGANLARLELRLLFGALTQRWTQPAGRHPARHRAEHLRRRGPPLRPRLRPPLMELRAGRPRGGRRPLGLPPARRRLGLVERRAGHRRRRVAARRHALRPARSPSRCSTTLRAVSPAAASIGTVVNTHANGDHCYGNQLVAGADIVASTASAARDGRGAPVDARRADAGGRRARRGRRLPPRHLRAVHLRRHRARAAHHHLRRRARPAASATAPSGCSSSARPTPRGDVVVHVPDADVLFTGDLVFHGGHPIVWAGPVAHWIEACDRMLALGADHGRARPRPAQRPRRASRTSAATSSGWSPRARRGSRAAWPRSTPPATWPAGPYDGWGEGERLVVNLTALARDLGQEPAADVLTLFGGMAELAKETAG